MSTMFEMKNFCMESCLFDHFDDPDDLFVSNPFDFVDDLETSFSELRSTDYKFSWDQGVEDEGLLRDLRLMGELGGVYCSEIEIGSIPTVEDLPLPTSNPFRSVPVVVPKLIVPVVKHPVVPVDLTPKKTSIVVDVDKLRSNTEKSFTWVVKPARGKKLQCSFAPMFPPVVRVRPSKYTVVLLFPLEETKDVEAMKIFPAIREQGKTKLFTGEEIIKLQEVSTRRVKKEFVGQGCLKFNVQIVLEKQKHSISKKNKIQIVLIDQVSGKQVIETNFFNYCTRKIEKEIDFWRCYKIEGTVEKECIYVPSKYKKKTGRKRRRKEKSHRNKKRKYSMEVLGFKNQSYDCTA